MKSHSKDRRYSWRCGRVKYNACNGQKHVGRGNSPSQIRRRILSPAHAVNYVGFCVVQKKLHKEQKRGRKHRSAIDTASLLIHLVNQILENHQVAVALLMDVNRAFDHVSRVKLAKRMNELG